MSFYKFGAMLTLTKCGTYVELRLRLDCAAECSDWEEAGSIVIPWYLEGKGEGVDQLEQCNLVR